MREEFNVDEIERDEAKSEEELQRKLTYEWGKEILEKKHIKQWKLVLFDKPAAFAYLVTRSPAEYAVLETILNEIKRKDPEFSPSTLFDFGSGVGTGYWATKKVFGKLGEVIETAMSCLRRGIPSSDPCYLDCVCCLTTFLTGFSVWTVYIKSKGRTGFETQYVYCLPYIKIYLYK